MALTGRPGRARWDPPRGSCRSWPDRPVRAARVDPLALLAERAAIAGLPRAGDISCGGATRLMPAADGWVALSLARPDDVDSCLPGSGGRRADDPWAAVGYAALRRDRRRRSWTGPAARPADGGAPQPADLGRRPGCRCGERREGPRRRAIPLRRGGGRPHLAVGRTAVRLAPRRGGRHGDQGGVDRRPDGARRGPPRSSTS